jgi:hypothetical protein
MPYLSPKLQVLREIDKRKKIADRSFNVLTNTPILNLNPKGVRVEGLTTKLKIELAKLSFEDFGLMCKNEAIRRMMARLLETNVEILKNVCKSANGVKKQIDTSSATLKDKRRANTLPIKNVVPKFLMAISAKPSKTRTIIDILPRDLILNIKNELKSLLKYELREWVPTDKLNSSLSKNYNAIDYLKKNENLIDYKILSSNTNLDAIELLRIQIKKDQNSINWEELSKNPNAIQLLQDNVQRINWVAFCCNPSPKMIAILKKKIVENPFNIDLYRNWSSLSSNTSNEAIAYLKDNFDNIDWEILSGNTNLEAIKLLKERVITNRNDLDWDKICKNENAIDIIFETLKHKPYYINWSSIACNTSNEAIKIIEWKMKDYPEKISWGQLSRNPSAIKILLANIDKIVWSSFSSNTNIINPDAIKLLIKKIEEDKIKGRRNNLDWSELSANPSIFVLS